MNRMRRAGCSKWTVVALAAMTLALAGCGRKAGLDLPPSTSRQPLANAAPGVDPDAQTSAGRGASLFAAPGGGDAVPEAQVRAERAKRGFILDPLLGN